MNIGLYGLLHLQEGECSAVNVSPRSFRDQIEIYVDNAINLSNSLQLRGIVFTLLTNRKEIIEDIIQPKEKVLRVEEIPFITKVPSGIRFYSAHFKLDAFRYLSLREDDYVGLCDLDMVCINDFPQCLANNIKNKIPMCYDISDQVIPAYGHNIIIRDLESILGFESEGRWSGGEFISGPPEFFLTLMKEIDGIYNNYIKNIETLHHIGDEAITSAALEKIRKNGKYIADAGTLGIVGRFWNTNTLHPQKPFEYYENCFLLHLPADKHFLADLASQKAIDRMFFVREYSAYRNAFPIKVKRLILRIMKTFVPRFLPNKSFQRTR